MRPRPTSRPHQVKAAAEAVIFGLEASCDEVETRAEAKPKI